MSDLLTLTELRERFPEPKPSIKLLRQVARREGKGRKWGRAYLLTEPEAKWLLLCGSVVECGTGAGSSRCASRTVGSFASELKNQQERQAKLERLGLLPIERNTTTSKHIGQKPKLAPHSPTRQ